MSASSRRTRLGGPVSTVVERAEQVLSGVLAATADGWSEDAARMALPAWFTAAFAPEPTDEEAAEQLRWWRTLNGEERARDAQTRPWTAAGWLSWLDLDEREWRWWDAYVDDETTARIAVEVAGWPFAIGALEWQLRGSGATTSWWMSRTSGVMSSMPTVHRWT